MDNAIGLARTSIEEQSRYSLDGQDKWTRDMAAKLGLNLIEVVREDGGHSDDINREGLKHLLMVVHEGKVKVVLTQYHDRLARGDNLALVLQWLRDHGVRLICGDLPNDVGDALDYLIAIHGTAGKIFLRTLRLKTREGIARAVEAGKDVGRPVAGLETHKGPPTEYGRAIYDAVEKDGLRAVYCEKRFTNPSTGKLASYSHLRLVYQNVKDCLRNDGTLEKNVETRSAASKRRYTKAMDDKLREAQAFRMWLLQHQPLRSERASL